MKPSASFCPGDDTTQVASLYLEGPFEFVGHLHVQDGFVIEPKTFVDFCAQEIGLFVTCQSWILLYML